MHNIIKPKLCFNVTIDEDCMIFNNEYYQSLNARHLKCT